MLNFRSLLLGCLRQLAVQILFHDETSDGNAVGGTPSTVLHVDSDGNLGVVHWCKAHEHRVVVASVLCRTRLATGGKVVMRQCLTGSTQCRRPHALHHVVVSITLRHRVAPLGVERIERLALHLLHHVGCNEIASVGNGGTQIGYLKRGCVYLTLSDGNGNDGQSVP